MYLVNGEGTGDFMGEGKRKKILGRKLKRLLLAVKAQFFHPGEKCTGGWCLNQDFSNTSEHL